MLGVTRLAQLLSCYSEDEAFLLGKSQNQGPYIQNLIVMDTTYIIVDTCPIITFDT